MNKKLETVLYSTVGVAAMFLILLAVNFLVTAARTRVDLTAEKLYTLSPGTKAILGKLDTKIKVRFYCTKGDHEMPVFLKTYAQRVEDLLGEYKQYAKGKLEIEKLNPRPDSDAEDSANLDGVEGQMTQTGEKIYLGLAVSCLDQKVALPFLSPEREKYLEYDLSRAISRAGASARDCGRHDCAARVRPGDEPDDDAPGPAGAARVGVHQRTQARLRSEAGRDDRRDD